MSISRGFSSMAIPFSSMAIPLAIIYAVFLLSNQVVLSDDLAPIPTAIGGIKGWFDANVKPFSARKGTLDPALEAAESAPPVIINVGKGGQFPTISAAVKSVKPGNAVRTIINIAPGEYNEKIKIEKGQNFITFYGQAANRPALTFGDTNLKVGTMYSGTVTVEAEHFMAVNIEFKNSAPKPTLKTLGGQALAIRITADYGAFYNCRFIGFQDTLCDDFGHHFFKDCYIEGTVDFIFGRGKSIYINCDIHVLGDDQMTVITAQNREVPSEDSGYSFVHCKITGTGSGTYLGRAWMPSPKTVFSFCEIGAHIQPVGWFNNLHPEREKLSYFGEYQCTGPGAKLDQRVAFMKKLTEADVKPMLCLEYIKGSKWLLPPPPPPKA